MSIRIGIAGMAGRMGQLLIEETAAAGAVCVGGTLRVGGKAAPSGLQSFPDIASLFGASDVVIDFTHADTAATHAAAAAACGKGFILGSSGLSAAAEAAVAEAGKRAPIVYAANFAPGVNLFLAIAERMAAALPGAQYDAEIVEMHHPAKVDAPSGTASRTAELMTQARKESSMKPMPDATKQLLDGARGSKVGDIPIHSIRAQGLVAHQEVLFGGVGETLTIRHDSLDRAGFMPGVLLGIRSVVKNSGLTHGLDKFM
jgi:4-hydroxy-tetrahydrodipicolinate reductase